MTITFYSILLINSHYTIIVHWSWLYSFVCISTLLLLLFSSLNNMAYHFNQSLSNFQNSFAPLFSEYRSLSKTLTQEKIQDAHSILTLLSTYWRKIPRLYTIYKKENKGTEKLHNLPKVAWQVNGKDGTLTQVKWLQNLCYQLLLYALQ